MATTSTTTGAQGSGPIAYTDGDGNQLVIPLSDIKFKDGKLQTDGVSADLATWLKYLFDQGQLSAGAQPPPAKPAFLIQATDPGTAGNDITIEISNLTLPTTPPTTPATFDATIKETHTYTGLSWNDQKPNYVVTILGTTTKPAAHPGLIHLQDAPTPPLVPNATPETPLANGGAATRASLTIAGAGPAAFVLEARKDGAEGNKIKVTIDNVDTGNETFRLVATYAPDAITDIDPNTNLPAKFEDAKWEIAVSAPLGATFALPAEDIYILTGGMDDTSGLTGGTKGASAAVTVKAQAS